MIECSTLISAPFCTIIPTPVGSPEYAPVLPINSFLSTEMSRLFDTPNKHFFAKHRPAILELLILQPVISTDPLVSMHMLPSSLPSNDTDAWLPLNVSIFWFIKKRLQKMKFKELNKKCKQSNF
jgi:hypothetical protein